MCIIAASKICSPWIPWEWYNVSDVVYSSGKQNHPFKAKPKPAMFDSPVSPEIEIPFVGLNWQSHLKYSAQKTNKSSIQHAM